MAFRRETSVQLVQEVCYNCPGAFVELSRDVDYFANPHGDSMRRSLVVEPRR